jgi:hypothetical protein
MIALANSSAFWANVLLVGGAAVISIFPQTAMNWKLFLGFLAGHLVWAMLGIRRKDMGLLVLNGGLIALDVYAIAIRW